MNPTDLSSIYMPHGHCYLWNPALVWINASTDGLIFLSYLAISFLLTLTVIRVKEIPFQKIYLAFGLFIVACGFGHLLELIDIWHPYYWVTAYVKIVTAIASVGTAVALPFYLPRIKELAQGAALVKTQKALEESNRALAEKARETEQTKQFLDSVIDNLPNMVFIKEAKELRYVKFNKAGAELFGISQDYFLGKTPTEIHPVEDAEKFSARDREVLASGEMKEFEETVETQFKGTRILQTKKVGLTGPDGAQFLLGIAVDLTTMKESEQALIAAREEAIAATNVKSEFLANMSHEIRTPLNGIIGLTDLLIDSGLTPTQEEYAKIVKHSGDSLLEIINDILDFSKIEAGMMDLSITSFSLEALLKSSLQVFHLRVLEKNIELISEIDPTIPKYLKGDTVRIGQILLNLVGNAVKFTKDGKVTVKVLRDGVVNHQLRIKFVIQDSGIGISEADQKKLFTPFTQADGSMARVYGGTGLGLSICKRLVNLMDGEIGVISKKNEGSAFWCTILTAEAQAPVENVRSLDEVVHPIASIDSSKSKRKILIAEDNANNQTLILALLKREGHEAIAVPNGRAVVDEYQKNDYDLILMDCQMPEMDGYEATTRIREIEKTTGKRIPILALTANARKSDEEKCREHGMDDFLTKPIRREGLTRALNQWLGLVA